MSSLLDREVNAPRSGWLLSADVLSVSGKLIGCVCVTNADRRLLLRDLNLITFNYIRALHNRAQFNM